MICWVSKQVGLELPTAEDRSGWRADKASWVLKPFRFTDKGAKILAMGWLPAAWASACGQCAQAPTQQQEKPSSPQDTPASTLTQPTSQKHHPRQRGEAACPQGSENLPGLLVTITAVSFPPALKRVSKGRNRLCHVKKYSLFMWQSPLQTIPRSPWGRPDRKAGWAGAQPLGMPGWAQLLGASFPS